MQPEPTFTATINTVDVRQPAEAAALLTDITVAALETMAFFCCDPASPESPWPDDARALRMSFRGHVSGTVTLVAGTFFGQRLASNALGCGVRDADAVDRAVDSLQEVLNVVVGMMMPRLARTSEDVFDLSLPHAEPFDAATRWESFVVQPGTTLIDAEGDTIAVRLDLEA